MNQQEHPENNPPSTPQPSIRQQADSSTIGGGMLAAIGDDNVQIHGDSNVLTFNKTEILLISIEEIKTRKFIVTSPYKGLKKFELEDKDLFFGRDQFLKELVNELEHTNLVLLLGASGIGKSSVVRAGLVPWLLQQWGTRLVHLTFIPDHDPFESLYASLLSKGKYKQTEAQIAREAKVDTLTHLVKKLKQPEDYWFIFIDQFEELFTTSQPQKCKQFIDSLVRLCKTKQHLVTIMATMRADFIDRLGNYSNLVNITQKHRPMITEMHPDELRLAIEQPAARHGVVFETGLVEEIIKNIQGQAGCLPLLQYTLNLLWETTVNTNNIEDRTLHKSTYRQLGGVRGALQKHVDCIYEALPENEKQATQRIFLKLVDIGGNGEFDTEWKPIRRRANRSEFSDQLEQTVLTNLINNSLLVSDRQLQSQASTIEIAHEILLTSWTSLNTWIRENRQAITLRNRLNSDAARWQDKKSEDELWTGAKLEQALELRKNETFKQVLGGFDEMASEFIDASAELYNRRRRRIIFFLTIFSGIVSILAVLTWWQSQNSLKSEIKAINANSQSFFVFNKEFDSFIEAIRAKQKLQQLALVDNSDIQNQILKQLQQAAYRVVEYNRLLPKDGNNNLTWSVAISPDGQLIASASDDKTVHLWNRHGSEQRILRGHEDRVWKVVFSQDNQIIASASQDKTVKLWNRDGKELHSLRHGDVVWGVAISPDNQIIASASNDKTVKLWSRDGKELHTLKGHDSPVREVVFSPDSQLIVSTSENGTVKLWSRDGQELRTLKGHQNRVAGAAFSPDGQLIATASDDGTAKLWSRDGKLLHTLKGHDDTVWGVAFSPDGQTIATASWDKTIKLWKRDGTLLTTVNGHTDRVYGVAFSPDGQTIASASEDKTVRLWRINNGLLNVLNGHSKSVIGVSFSPNSQLVASASDDKTVKLWDRNGILQKTLKHTGSVLGVEISPDGKTIASGTWDGNISIWNIDGKLIRIIPRKGKAVWDVAFSPDGQTIASANFDGTVKLWSRDGKELHTFKGHRGEVREVAFSPDGRLIASAGFDGTVRLWKLDGTLLTIFKEHRDAVLGLAFSPDGQTIASASLDRTVKLWKLDGTLVKTFTGHEDGVKGVSFSPDGQTIASASVDRSIKLWNRDGSLLNTLRGHKDAVWKVKFSPDGQKIVSTSEDKTVIIWNRERVQTLNSLVFGCDWVRDYLMTNPDVSQSDRHLCDKVTTP